MEQQTYNLTLDLDLHKAIRKIAFDNEITMAELVRKSVKMVINKPSLLEKVLKTD